jgi:hypothetical protein
MLVNCPRCGFEQPKDKYCAQCGVDTETFKPPRKSAFKSFITSPALFLGIAIIATVVFFKTVHKPDTASLTKRVQFLKGTLQIANRSSEKSAEPASRDIASTDTAAAAPESAQAAAPAATSTTAALIAQEPAPAATVAATVLAPAAKVALNADEPNVTAYYAEVPSRAMDKIREESQATGQFNSFGDYTAGILPELEKRIRSEALKIQILETTQRNITNNEHWFHGIHDAEFDEELGLTTLVELSDFENGTFHGRAEIIRSWRDAADAGTPGALQKTSYPAIFELNPGAGLFIAGVLPRKSHVAHLAELTGKKPFQVLDSVSFQNKESEFVIFIEFKKKP